MGSSATPWASRSQRLFSAKNCYLEIIYKLLTKAHYFSKPWMNENFCTRAYLHAKSRTRIHVGSYCNVIVNPEGGIRRREFELWRFIDFRERDFFMALKEWIHINQPVSVWADERVLFKMTDLWTRLVFLDGICCCCCFEVDVFTLTSSFRAKLLVTSRVSNVIRRFEVYYFEIFAKGIAWGEVIFFLK